MAVRAPPDVSPDEAPVGAREGRGRVERPGKRADAPTLSRRALIGASAAAAAIAPAARAMSAVSLPDKTNFHIDHAYLNAAFAHPMGKPTYQAIESYLQSRMRDIDRPWPSDNPRDEAVRLYAELIGAAPADVAVVASTQEGENLVAQCLELGPRAGVVTDAFHYSIPLYGELARRGVPVTVVRPRNGVIELADLDRAIGANTSLVAISHIASDNGFKHDLKAVCEIAHAKGALVYADVIQSVGAIPFDVRDSGVDFACAGAYKWLMAEFGAAFLYARPDRLAGLGRSFVGWRQYASYQNHMFPFDPPGEASVDWALGEDAVGRFEVSTPAWGALAGVTGAIPYIQSVGVEAMVRHRAPLLARMRAELPRYGFTPMTPDGTDSPALALSCEGAAARFGPALKAARIRTHLSRHRIRLSPSVYNDMGDIDQLLRALASAA